ncbi:type VI secretion system lipoprotein TssJ [Noviherbaspirillum aerium]|uniref:type VI secretion system lipoprotein TssJ n=1 Tax=Noviherbaspirillum aerium TaxID=2588497 RepID=UPI00124E0929|nr:type VI secretion system lipoprotein TssJ [Noviherbaspirillum aerium]
MLEYSTMHKPPSLRLSPYCVHTGSSKAGCRSPGRLIVQLLLALFCALVQSGCVSTANGNTKPGADTLLGSLAELLGNKQKAEQLRMAEIRLEASKDANADEHGNGLATVLRVYQLRNAVGFLSIPHGVLLDAQSERNMLGNSMIEAREITLLPGQSLRFTESLTEDASHLGFVALFRKRSGQRWRLAFTSADAARSGIVIGVHACAMTATGATPLTTSTEDALLLSAAPCR